MSSRRPCAPTLAETVPPTRTGRGERERRTPGFTAAADPVALARLADEAPCALVSTTAEGNLLHVNETLLAWTGRRRDDLVGRSFEELLTPAGRLFYQTRYLPVLRLGGEVREAALTLRGAGATDLPVLASSVLRPGRDGGDEVVIALFDATGRRNYERELLTARRAADRSERRVRVLQEASLSFGDCETEGALAAALGVAARGAAEARSSAVFLLDGGVLRRVAGDGDAGDGIAGDPAASTPSAAVDGAAVVAQDGPEAEAARTASAVTVARLDDAERFPELAERLAARRIEAMSAVPIHEDGVPLGVLACYSGRAREWDSDAIELQAALARQAGQVLRRIRLQESLRHSSLHDTLTALPNRAHLHARLADALAEAAESGRPLALLFLDLDGFKVINDRLGHAVGDDVLAQVAERLRRLVRRGDTVARFGGDEFAIVCVDADAPTAVRVADRVRAAIRERLRQVPAEYPLTASVGVAVHAADSGAVSAGDLIEAADGAMYRSKSEGRDRSSVVTIRAEARAAVRPGTERE